MTPNFKKSEFLHSDTAAKNGMSNDLPPYLEANLQALAERLQAVRELVSAPITISSGYRSPALNRLVGGVSNSQHQLGLAADIHAAGYTADKLYAKIKSSGIKYDQLIIEKVRESEWVHISVQPQERQQNLAIKEGV